MFLKIYTDGGALNNPGEAAIAYVIYQDEKLIFKYSQRIGIATNNFAEYQALVKALEKVKELLQQSSYQSVEKIYCYADSSLMVNQLNGLYKVKNADIRMFIIKVRVLEQEIKIPLIYTNIPREKNRLADSLVKQALRS